MKLLLLVIAVLLAVTSAFSPIQPSVSRASTVARRPSFGAEPTFLQLAFNDENGNDKNGIVGNMEQADDAVGGLDAEGFAGYLAPYALAVILSIGVTGAFVKFVLMDY